MFQFLGYSNVDFQTLRSTTTASYAEISLVSNLPIKLGDFLYTNSSTFTPGPINSKGNNWQYLLLCI